MNVTIELSNGDVINVKAKKIQVDVKHEDKIALVRYWVESKLHPIRLPNIGQVVITDPNE